jgi:hypothetical protein
MTFTPESIYAKGIPFETMEEEFMISPPVFPLRGV